MVLDVGYEVVVCVIGNCGGFFFIVEWDNYLNWVEDFVLCECMIGWNICK